MRILFHIQNLSRILKIIDIFNIKLSHIFEIVFKRLNNNIFDYTIMTNDILELYDIDSIYTLKEYRQLEIHLNVLCSNIVTNAIINDIHNCDLVFLNKGGDNVLLQSRANINRY